MADLVAIDRELAEVGERLSRLGDSIRVDVQNEDAFTAVLTAAAELHVARLHLQHGKRGA